MAAQVADPLRCPDLSSLIALAAIPHGQGHADWVDALMVAADRWVPRPSGLVIGIPPTHRTLYGSKASKNSLFALSDTAQGCMPCIL